MRRTRHLLQGIQHRVVRRFQEHDITRVTLYDLIHRLAVYVTQLLQRLQNQRKLLFLAQSDGQHRCKTGDTMTFRLQVTELIEHETCFVKPIHPGFRRTLTPAFTSGGSRLSLCRNAHTFLHPALGAVAQPPPY